MSASASPAAQALVVAVVDDDGDLRRALWRLLNASGYQVQTYDSAEAFLASHDAPDCLLLDVHLRGMTGLALYDQLRQRPDSPGVVFITAHSNAAAEITRRGLVCLTKPFDDRQLLQSIDACRRG